MTAGTSGTSPYGYVGFASGIAGVTNMGSLTAGAQLANTNVTGFYVETYGTPNPSDAVFVVALEGDVANVTANAWCVSFVDYRGDTYTFESANGSYAYDGQNSSWSFDYASDLANYPQFREIASYSVTDCTGGGSSGSGGGGGFTSADFNCDCESIPLPADGYTTDTLANLRTRVAIRAGYAAQASNLPAGMISLINEFLRDAQNQIYRTYFAKRLTRLYSWPMDINQRYYGFDATNGVDCRVLDPNSVDWVGFEDLNQAWYPLVCGIDPVLYTRAQISTGWPTHYEIRNCIEIFPAPRAAYTLWVKGRFGLDPFTSDANTTTVDAEAVYLLATGMLKAHYGQPDAQLLLTQASNYIKYLVAGQHDTRRYVPRTRVQTPMTPPRFLPLES